MAAPTILLYMEALRILPEKATPQNTSKQSTSQNYFNTATPQILLNTAAPNNLLNKEAIGIHLKRHSLIFLNMAAPKMLLFFFFKWFLSYIDMNQPWVS